MRSLRKVSLLLLALVLLFGSLLTVQAVGTYTINGVEVRYDDFSSEPHECWEYANSLYHKIWGKRFNNQFGESSNMLRNLPDEALVLTPERLKEYVSQAALGACLRICDMEYLHGGDGWGHSQIIVQKDENGFTVLEGGLTQAPYCREHYYTWSDFCKISWLGGKYGYIKYIKWPGAPAYEALPDTGYLTKCTAFPSYGTLEVTAKSCQVRTLPCGGDADPGSKDIEKAKKGAQYTAVGLYCNAAGEYWYAVLLQTGSGTGFLPAEDTTMVALLEDVTAANVVAPQTYHQGKSFSIQGRITANYVALRAVGAYVEQDGQTVTGKENLEVSGQSYELKGSALDNGVKFGSLTPGTYTYCVRAVYETCYVQDGILQRQNMEKLLHTSVFAVVEKNACIHVYEGGTCTLCGAAKPYTLGDVNEDGKIDNFDLLRMLYHANKRVTLTASQLLAADVTGDGAVNVWDIQRMVLFLNKRIDTL